MTTRIQFELSDELMKELEQLMTDAGIVTRKDLFNNALTLLKWAVQEIKNGRIIASIDEPNEKFKQLIMPIFSNVTKSNK